LILPPAAPKSAKSDRLLGDTYYSGNNNESQENIIAYWPAAQKGNFTLNGNHEMYHSAVPYFNLVLQTPLFSLQQGTSFFALENSHWVIVGLDTAFFADRKQLYMTGNLNQTQIDFLSQQAKKGKPVIVLSHHNGLDITGSEIQSPLWNQVTDALGDTLKYWYWGHVHMGAVYKPKAGIKTRVVGHGVIPYGHAEKLTHSEQVVWFETTSAEDQHNRFRVQNGFLMLDLNEQNITERFYGEDGKVHWDNTAANS
jgi:hypothetical protein